MIAHRRVAHLPALTCGVLVAALALLSAALAQDRTPDEEALERWQSFNQRYDNRWSVEWSPLTGAPRRLWGHQLELPASVDERNVESVTRGVVAELSGLLGLEMEQLRLARAHFEEPRNRERRAGTWYVYYRQVYEGLPVEGGSVRLVVRDNRVTSLTSEFVPGIEISPQPTVARETAIETIQRARPEPGRVEPRSQRLIVYPKRSGRGLRHHLAWDITMPVENVPREVVLGAGEAGVVSPDSAVTERPPREEIPVQWRYLVDAHTGRIIDRVNLINYEDLSGNVKGQIHPKGPGDVPEERPIAHMKVLVTQGAATASSATTASGDFVVSGLASGPADLEARLEGDHVVVFNDGDETPEATHAATVNVPGTHGWDWADDDSSPAHVETNVYHHLDTIQSWFLDLGLFSGYASPYPTPDPMKAFVRMPEGCNAWAGPDGLGFYQGSPGRCEDFALCADIVYHEYTHRIVAKVYDEAGVSFPYRDQTGAMNEGWSDYFGCTNTGDSGHGTRCYSGRDIDWDKRFPDDWQGQVHADGLIFSGALWDVRAGLGAAYVDALALRAMMHAETSFAGYLRAVLSEDDDPGFSTDPGSADNDPGNGTPNIDAICASYWDVHGIVDPWCVGHTGTAIAQLTAPPPTERYWPFYADATIPIEGSAAGSGASPLQGFVLEYAHRNTPDTWETSGITLADGGTVPVSGGVLGELDLSALDDGQHEIRLTVTTADGSMARTTSRFVLDRALMNGWPLESDVHFYGSPAVADVDPAHAGLEVVANGNDEQIHVWHADGTPAPGWPQFTGFSYAPPAVADLDGDRSLEVVLGTYYGQVFVFAQDGSGVPGWPTSISGKASTPALIDLDDDGDLEIVIASTGQSVHAWHHDGTVVAGWPTAVDAEARSSPAVGDLDGDGVPEVVVGTGNGTIHAWHADGVVVAGWPQTLAPTTEISGSAALADLDDDGDLEVVVGTEDFEDWNNRQVYAWHHDGSLVSGWPQPFATPPSFGGFQMWPSSAQIADVDGDGTVEVVIMSNDARVHVWKPDGTRLAGWPPDEPGFNGWDFVVSSPAVADIDGDGDMEVLAEEQFDVYAIHHDGSPVAGWPKTLSWYWSSPPAVADIDQDGDVEVLMGSRGMFVWDLAGAFDATSAEWPFYRGDNRRTGSYRSSGAQPAPSPIPAGVVLAFAGTVADVPDGWLPCDGREVFRSQYPSLFGAIGSAHGQGDGVTTFNLPDYRGFFLRGVDHDAGNDPDSATRTPLGPSPSGPTTVGSVQGDASRRPDTPFEISAAGQHAHRLTADAAGGHSHDLTTGSAGAHGHDLSTQSAGSHGHSFTTASGGVHRHTYTYTINHHHNGRRIDRYDDGGDGLYEQDISGSTAAAGGHTHGGPTSTVGGHVHQGSTVSAGAHTHSGSTAAVAGHTHAGSTASEASHVHTISGGDRETRPRNKYVNWIIKH